MKYSNSYKNKKDSILKRAMIASFLFCFFVVIFSIFSETAHASLFSFISGVFEGQTASANIIPSARSYINSQNIALLQPAVNIDPNPNKSLGVAPVESNALVSELAMSSIEDTNDVVNTQISLYVVRPGDTLSEIAHMFNVSVNTIMWANNISKAKGIKPGDNLIILPVTGIKYTIKKGDTIKSIVSNYKADLNEVLDYNDITLNSTLTPGQTILIPDAEITTTVSTKMVYTAGSNPAHDTNGPDYKGYYIRPISSSCRESQGLHGYNAVDLACPIGTTIVASASGKVIASVTNGGWNGGYGNYVIISHSNGTQTLYAHTSKNYVSVGQIVEQGQKIAAIGMTGKTTGPHVHFEIRGAKNPF